MRFIGADSLAVTVDSGDSLTIKDCKNHGIYASNTAPDLSGIIIDNCNASTSTYAGIYILSPTGASYIHDCTIKNSQKGMVLLSGIDVELEQMDIQPTNEQYSIQVDSYSDLDMDYKNNNVDPIYGKQAIYKSSSAHRIWARGNWWGQAVFNPDSLFYPKSQIYYSDSLTTPCADAGAPKIAVQIASDLFKDARFCEKNKNWPGAVSIYNSILAQSQEPADIKRAIQRLVSVHDKSDRTYDDVRQAIDANRSIFDETYLPVMDMVLCDLMVREGKYSEAINNMMSVSAQYRGTPFEVYALTDIAFVYGIKLNNKEKSKEFADRAALIDPSSHALIGAYACAGLKYTPVESAEREFDTQPEPQMSDIENSIAFSPNPFNPAATFNFSIANPGHVTLTVYAITGQKVATLVDETMTAGSHNVIFDGRHLGSGMYFYRFESPGFARSGKMLLVK